MKKTFTSISDSDNIPYKHKKKITKNNILKFLQDEFSKHRIKEYLILIFAALLCTISYDYFIAATTKSGLFPPGLGALARISAMYTSGDGSQQNLFYFIYLFLFNFPLFIFSVVKISLRFSFKTILFILFQILFNYIITSIPYINPNDFHFLVNYNYLMSNATDANYQIWLFVFAILSGVTYGSACALAYSINGSSGGTDFFSMYISIKRKRSIGNVNKYINVFILLVVLTLNTFHISLSEFHKIFHADAGWTIWTYRVKYIFGAALFASLLFILIQSMVINFLYPKYEYRTLFIITKKSDAVIFSMRKIGTVLNDISVWDTINSQLDEKQDTKGYKVIMCTITLLEYRKVKTSIIQYDPAARIFLQKVDRIAGTFKIRNNL